MSDSESKIVPDEQECEFISYFCQICRQECSTKKDLDLHKVLKHSTILIDKFREKARAALEDSKSSEPFENSNKNAETPQSWTQTDSLHVEKNLTTLSDNFVSKSPVQVQHPQISKETLRTDSLLSPSSSELSKSVNQNVEPSSCKPVLKKSKRKPRCKFCQKLFSSIHSLIVHERRHTGEKPLECDYCDERFAHSAHRSKHIDEIHPDKVDYVTQEELQAIKSNLKKTQEKHSSKPFSSNSKSRKFGKTRTRLQKHAENKIEKPRESKQIPTIKSKSKINLNLNLNSSNQNKNLIEKKQTQTSQNENGDEAFTMSNYIFPQIFEGKVVFVCKLCFILFSDLSVALTHVNTQGREELKNSQINSKSQQQQRGINENVTGLDPPKKVQELTALATLPVDVKKKKKVNRSRKLKNVEGDMSKYIGRHPSSGTKRVCKICHKTFSDVSKIRRHIPLHTGQKFKCSFKSCGKIYPNEEYRDSHERSVHGVQNIRKRKMKGN